MSGPYDINGLGANYFTTLQPAFSPGATPSYSAYFTSAAINITAGLTEMCNIAVTPGKTLIILRAELSALNATSGTVATEIEVDGVVVLSSSSAASTATSLQLIGYSSAPASSNFVANVQVNKALKARATKPLSTTAVLTLWCIERA